MREKENMLHGAFIGGAIVFVIFISMILYGPNPINAPVEKFPKPNHTTVDSKNNVVVEWYTQCGAPRAKVFYLKKGQVQTEGEVITVNFLPR